jgi:hypothetical protein
MPGSGVQLGLFDGLLAGWFGRPAGPAATPAGDQPSAPPATDLARRLSDLGLPAFPRIVTHRNDQVMLSWTPGKVLRVHEGYGHAPDDVLRAIVRFVRPGTRRDQRAIARQQFLAFPVEQFAPPPNRPRREALRPADGPILERLGRLHAELNQRYFGGALAEVPLVLSPRMRRRLGEIRLERAGARPVHIAISRRHIRRDGWALVAETLLHEMVHQWQAETGRPVDHGTEFRRKALEVGIEPRAVRRDW